MHLGIAILVRRNMDENTHDDDNFRQISSNSLFTFLEPFSFSVWIALVIAYLSVAGMMYILAKFSPYEWSVFYCLKSFFRFDDNQRLEYDHNLIQEEIKSIPSFKMLKSLATNKTKNQFNLLNSAWFAIGSLMQQGSDVIPRAAATRTVAVIWYLLKNMF